MHLPKAFVLGTPVAVAGLSALVIGGATPAFAGTTADRTDQFTFVRFSTGRQITCSIANHIENPPYHNEAHLAFASMKLSGPQGCSGHLFLGVSYVQPDGGFASASETTSTKLELADEFAPVKSSGGNFTLSSSVTFVDCTTGCSYSGAALSNP